MRQETPAKAANLSARPSHEWWLLYDADCGFCQRWCDWARSRGAEPAIEFVSCQAATDLREQASIGTEECGHAAILVERVDGQVTSVRRAAAAINGVLRVLPGRRNLLLRVAGRVYPLPVLKQIEDAGYRLIARFRHRLGSGSCRAPKP